MKLASLSRSSLKVLQAKSSCLSAFPALHATASIANSYSSRLSFQKSTNVSSLFKSLHTFSSSSSPSPLPHVSPFSTSTSSSSSSSSSSSVPSLNSKVVRRLIQKIRSLSTSAAAEPIRVENVEAIPVHSEGEQSYQYTEEEQAQAKKLHKVGVWLLVCCGMVFAMVVLGGVTRLTNSGLSMVEWKPTTILPPMNQAEWEAEFEKYKKFPEYQRENLGMDVEGFKSIFWLEYLHRLWGRAIGLGFLLPWMYFAARGYTRGPLNAKLGGIFALICGQGAIGWYMVKSGLHDETIITQRTSVNPYRLATHLGSAFVIYASMLWTGLGLLKRRNPLPIVNALPASVQRFRPFVGGLTALVFTTVMSGAFVAGMDAGMIYNEFPKMGKGFVPVEAFELTPLWRNFFENPAMAQFDHRVLAMTSLGAITATFLAGRKLPLSPTSTRWMKGMLHMSYLQVALGIATLLTYVPVSLGAIHQAGSLTLFTLSIGFLHSLRNPATARLVLSAAARAAKK